jgi:hypothetical protein
MTDDPIAAIQSMHATKHIQHLHTSGPESLLVFVNFDNLKIDRTHRIIVYVNMLLSLAVIEQKKVIIF